MNKSSICAALAVAIGLSAGATSGVAQIRDELAAPAELPPASFTGRQYVDSRGCVYIRAGIDAQRPQPLCIAGRNDTPVDAGNRCGLAGFQAG